MRQVLVDYARARGTKKRSGDEPSKLRQVEWSTDIDAEANPGTDQIGLLDLDSALSALEREDKTMARLVEMRYFGGMTAEETAEVLGRSVHIIRHDLRLAQAWLRRKLTIK